MGFFIGDACENQLENQFVDFQISIKCGNFPEGGSFGNVRLVQPEPVIAGLFQF